MIQTSTRLLLGATLVLTPLATAQDGSRNIDLPADGYVQSAIGEYTGQKWHHAVLLKEQHAWLWLNPTSHSSLAEMGDDWLVNDVATVRRTGTAPRDTIVGIGPDGLTMGQYDSSQAFSWSVLGTGNWCDGLRLDCVGTTEAAWVIGLADDQRTVGIGAVEDGVLIADQWADQGGTVKDLALFDWDDDGVMEVAVLTGRSLRILDSTLSPLVVVQNGEGRLARLRNSGNADELAWVRPAGGGSHELVVVSPLGLSTPLALSLPLATGSSSSWSLVGISSGEDNGDGLDDLVISQNQTSEFAVLYRQSGTTPFALPSSSQYGRMQAYGASPSAAGTLLGPVQFGELSNDALADFVFTGGGSIAPKVYVHYSTVDYDLPLVEIIDDFDFTELIGFDDGTFRIPFTVPEGLPQDCHLQILVWISLNPLSGATPALAKVATVPYADYRHLLAVDPVSGLYLEQQQVVLEMRGLLNADHWKISYQGSDLQPHLWIQARYIVLDNSDGSIADAGTEVKFGMTLNSVDDEDFNKGELAGMPFMTQLMSSNWGPLGPEMIIRGRTRNVGGIVPVTNLPKTDDGFPPVMTTAPLAASEAQAYTATTN